MRIVAFDLSLTATGVASDAGVEVLNPPASCSRGVARLRWLRGAVVDRATADLVVLEGYGFAPGRGHAARELGELGGVIRVALVEAGARYVEIPPACLKKYATGKGNASKDAVLAEAIRRLGYAGSSTDEADALWLYAMARDYYGVALAELPKAHRAARDAVKWPALIVAQGVH